MVTAPVIFTVSATLTVPSAAKSIVPVTEPLKVVVLVLEILMVSAATVLAKVAVVLAPIFIMSIAALEPMACEKLIVLAPPLELLTFMVIVSDAFEAVMEASKIIFSAFDVSKGRDKVEVPVPPTMAIEFAPPPEVVALP